MDKKYIELFKTLAQNTAASAETVMEYDRQQGDDGGLETATIMRNDFQSLADRIDSEDYSITKSDAAKLLVGAMIIVNQLQDKIAALKKSMTGYQAELIPKLQLIADAASDEEAKELADKNFILDSNK